MNIEVINTAQEVTKDKVENKTVVVIDILRATSVMTTAIENGALKIIPVLTPEEAFETKKALGSDVILGGERHAELIPGFDYGNSPLSYTPEVIHNKTLIITTTNGTLAIRNAMDASRLLIGSFLNAQAVVDFISSHNDIVLVCSGNNGVYTLEDNLCAGYFIQLLKHCTRNILLSDSAIASYQLFLSTKNDVTEVASQGYHYNVLKNKNFLKDLNECFTKNKFNTVPLWNGRSLIKAVLV